MYENGNAGKEQGPIAMSKEAVQDNGTKLDQFKKYSVYILIAGVVISALISIIAVLIGDFNAYIIKALFSTGWIVLHSLVALSFVSMNAKRHEISKEVQLNTAFVLVIASFFTSVLATWEVISRVTTVHLYFSYVIAIIAAWYCGVILQTIRADKPTIIAANSTIATTIILYFYSLPWIFEDGYEVPDLYKRIFISISILLGMFTMLTAIFSKMYINKHPEITAFDPNIGKLSMTPVAKAFGSFTKILLILIIAPFILTIISHIFGFLRDIFSIL